MGIVEAYVETKSRNESKKGTNLEIAYIDQKKLIYRPKGRPFARFVILFRILH